MRRPRGTLLPTVETGSITLQGSAAFVEAARRRIRAIAVVTGTGPARRCADNVEYTQRLEVSLGPKPLEHRDGHR